MQTIELWVGSGSAHGEEFAGFEYKLALVQSSAGKMSGKVSKDSEYIAWSVRSGLLIKSKWSYRYFMFTEQSFHFSPLPLNFWICLHRRVSLPSQRLYLNRTVALCTSLSLEINPSLCKWHYMFCGDLCCLGSSPLPYQAPNYWVCKGVAFLSQLPKDACQSQIGADNLTVFCRGAPPFSMDLLLK